MLSMRKTVASLFASALMFAGLAGTAIAQPLVTGGLVNITVYDVLNNNTILSNNNVNLGVALNLAANVCDVNVNVLARQLRNGGAECSNGAQRAVIDQVAG